LSPPDFNPKLRSAKIVVQRASDVNFFRRQRHFMANTHPAPMRSETCDVASLYQRHGLEVLQYLARRCAVEAAEDLLQETFLQAVRSADRLPGVTLPRAWLFGIARHVLARHYQRPADFAPLPEIEPRAVDAAPEDQRLPAVREAINQLAPELRETLELRLNDELSYEEIAGVLGIPIGTVRSRLHHAVLRLRSALTESKSSL
jgi:RNA polymerase sigma-70 factor (ECF subfamily)